MSEGTQETLRQAVASIPGASWSDAAGEWQNSQDILNSWPAEKLDQPAVIGEDAQGMTAIRALDGEGQQGKVLLTMVPPSGAEIPPVPVVQPES